MKRKIAQYPYNDYYIYVVFHKYENRYYANLVPINKCSNLKRHTISYARYLMSVKEGRILGPHEHVDHIDNNRLNDDISNLQILSPVENNIKAAKLIKKKMVLLKCPNCGIVFEREKRNTHLIKGGMTTSCSRSCASKFGMLFHYNPNNPELIKRISDNIIKEFSK